MPTIETFIDVKVPVQTAYDQWRKFEKFPQFMEGVKQGKHINTYRLHWKAEIVGRGVVTFQPISDVMSTVVLQLAYIPGGVVENEEDGVEALSVRIRKELKRFKAFVESGSQVRGNWLTSLPYHAFF
jgi:uncharacterized membrane protein